MLILGCPAAAAVQIILLPTYLSSSFSAKPQRCGVSRTLEARDGFLELQDGFMRFLKHHTFGADYAE
jgi:hypothetical protein